MRYDGPSHRRGPHQGLREIVRTGSDLRPLLDHVGVDVRIRGAGTARGVERQHARDAMRMLERAGLVPSLRFSTRAG